MGRFRLALLKTDQNQKFIYPPAVGFKAIRAHIIIRYITVRYITFNPQSNTTVICWNKLKTSFSVADGKTESGKLSEFLRKLSEDY